MKRHTFWIDRNTAVNSFDQIFHFSFSGEGMNGIHFPDKTEIQTTKIVMDVFSYDAMVFLC